MFARFPMLAERRGRAARTLSGGQRQVLAMAMALMVQPALLLLDEPSAGLSPIAAEALFATIRAINRDGIAIAMVEQNADAGTGDRASRDASLSTAATTAMVRPPSLPPIRRFAASSSARRRPNNRDGRVLHAPLDSPQDCCNAAAAVAGHARDCACAGWHRCDSAC